MKDSTTRRDVLRGAGAVITLAMLADAFGAAAPVGSGKQVSAGVNVLTLLYPAGSFDFDYYRNSYLKVLKGVYGKSVERIEVREVIAPPQAPGAPAPTLPFSAVVNVWIKDPAAFQASSKKGAGTLAKEAERFTKLVPTVQFDTVHGAMGAARGAPQIGERCLMFLYPNSDGAHWDVTKYTATQMPLIMELYGSAAIRRLEVRAGERGSDAGSKPAYLGLVSIYVADQAAMQAAGRTHGARLMAENAGYSSVDPVVVPSLIRGVV